MVYKLLAVPLNCKAFMVQCMPHGIVHIPISQQCDSTIIAGKIRGTKFWQMSKKGCFGEYNFCVSALAAHVLRPAFILAPKFGEQLSFCQIHQNF